MPLLVVLLQVVAVVTTVIACGPQIRQALASEDRGAISASAWAQATAIGLAWSLWGALAGVWTIAISEGLFAVGSLAVLALVISRGWFALVALIAIASGVLLVLLASASALGIIACAASASARMAQLTRVLTYERVEAVSASTWALLATASGAWAAYGLAVGQWPLVAGGLISVGCSLAVTFATRWKQRQMVPLLPV